MIVGVDGQLNGVVPFFEHRTLQCHSLVVWGKLSLLVKGWKGGGGQNWEEGCTYSLQLCGGQLSCTISTTNSQNLIEF